MYIFLLTLFLYALSGLILRKLYKNKGDYTIPDFLGGGYRSDILEGFKHIPSEVVERHYSLDSWYIALYVAASMSASLMAYSASIKVWLVPAILGLATGILDSFENYILKKYYNGGHSLWMSSIASRVTRIKGIFALGWFTAVPIYLFWVLFKWLIS
jgi:hypothetical protein